MDPRQQLEEILPLLTGLVSNLDEKQLDGPTVCANYNVRNVLQHMIGGANIFGAQLRGEVADAGVEEDVINQFPKAMAELWESVNAEGALERTIHAPFGEVPGEIFIRFTCMDGMVHGYDIASATGQAYEPRAELVAEVDAFTRQAIQDGMRDGDVFAKAVEPPAGATPIMKLAAFTGRQV